MSASEVNTSEVEDVRRHLLRDLELGNLRVAVEYRRREVVASERLFEKAELELAEATVIAWVAVRCENRTGWVLPISREADAVVVGEGFRLHLAYLAGRETRLEVTFQSGNMEPASGVSMVWPGETEANWVLLAGKNFFRKISHDRSSLVRWLKQRD